MLDYYPCKPYHDSPDSWNLEASSCPTELTTSEDGGVLTATNPSGTDNSWDAGLFGADGITTIGAIEFQFIFTLPDTVTHEQALSLSNIKLTCHYPGYNGSTPTQHGMTALLSRVADSTISLLTLSYNGGAPDTNVITNFIASTDIFKFTLDAGVWKIYRNGILLRTFAFDSAGAPMKFNISSAWANSEIRLLRFSNTALF